MTLGMNPKLGPISYVEKHPKSEEFSKLIDTEVQRLVIDAEKAAKELLSRHSKEIHAVSIFMCEKLCI
jgi:ATP-dependent Zn protease